MAGCLSGISGFFEEIRTIQFRQLLAQLIGFGMIVASALLLWKGWMFFTGSESPIVVVLSESMEPGFRRGDILFLHMDNTPVRAGEIVVFHIDGRDVPIVHRVIKVHQDSGTGEVDVLTKGDHNPFDDRSLYAEGQMWVKHHHIMGRAVGYLFCSILPYGGWMTILFTDKPWIKYLVTGALGLFAIISSN